MNPAVLEMRNVSVTYGGLVPAVMGIDLTIASGEIVGIIGESGSGKSTLAHSILGLLPKTAQARGDGFSLAGNNILEANDEALRALRGPAAAMIFQNPMTAFSPIHTLGKQLVDMLWRERHQTVATKRERIVAALKQVGIPGPIDKLDAYPFQLSGGMLQRTAIAAALLMRPALVIADEPTTALDVTMEAQILHLMSTLKSSAGASILIISHHLGVIAEICDRVAVMYAGKIVEEGPVDVIFRDPRHPYTQALFACEPALTPVGAGRLPVIGGEVARAGASGCGFAARCLFTEKRCLRDSPLWAIASADPTHHARCHRSTQ